MDMDVFRQEGINYQSGIHRFGGSQQIYEKYLKKYPMDPTYSELGRALEENNYEEAFRYAHTLKGIVGNLAFDDLYGALLPLVEALRRNELDELDSMFEAVKKEQIRVCRALTQI
ncbi:MAG: Hpt domain-containing protein [Lachnospiraceae bacterium]|nr:Hpt domain-containing protein [Lachnospiraceae bacterium]